MIEVEKKPVILVVDDTEEIRELLSVVLARKGFEVITAAGGAEMDAKMKAHHIDLVVLDIMMPIEDGFTICRRLALTEAPPIIMLSAKGDDLDKIKGLDLGAEDYVAKPFNSDELVSRIRAVLRRAAKARAAASVDQEVVFGWRLDNRARKITSPSGVELALSTAEFSVLRALVDTPDRPLMREFILSRMAELHEHSTPRALDMIVSRLRRKLAQAEPGTPDEEELIQTVYGVGYMLRPSTR